MGTVDYHHDITLVAPKDFFYRRDIF
jgi:hypothetical protein